MRHWDISYSGIVQSSQPIGLQIAGIIVLISLGKLQLQEVLKVRISVTIQLLSKVQYYFNHRSLEIEVLEFRDYLGQVLL